MDNLGKSFSEIRNGRNLTQKQVAAGVCSDSQVSAFEKGESKITLANFYGLIQNAGSTLEEFEYIVNGFNLNSFQRVLTNITKLFDENDIRGLKKVLSQEEDKLRKGVIRSELTCLMIKHVIFEVDHTEPPLSDGDKEKLANYLVGIDHWGWYELILYGNTMRAFPATAIHIYSNEAISRSAFYKSIPRNKTLLARILINTVIALVGYKEIELAVSFKSHAEKFLEERDVFERAVFHFVSGAIDFYTNREELGKKKMEEAIAIFDIVGSTRIAASYQRNYEGIVGNVE